MGVLEFLNRHRNKILLLGGAAGTIIAINKILASYEQQWQTSSSRGFVIDARKREIHFENLINECNQLCQRMSLQIINRLGEILDDSKLIESLKSKQQDDKVQNKVEIWKALKVKLLTRLLSEMYSICILVCHMRVQMSIVGGQVFASSVSNDTAGSSSASVADLTHTKTYTKYIALSGSFYDKRLDQLIQPIEEVVEETLRGYSMDYVVSIQDFKVILDKIKRSVSFFLTTKTFLQPPDKMSADELATICPESGQLNEADEQMLRNMLAETHDIIETDDFKNVLESSIEVGHALLLDTLLGAFIKMESKLNNKGHNPGFSNPHAIKVPLVQILPEIRTNYKRRNETDQKALVNHLLCLDVLNCFAANVYEAFCVPK